MSPGAFDGLPPAILVGGFDNGLAAARSLGRSGVEVYALGCARSVRASRFVRWIPHEEAGPSQTAWLRWLLEEGPRRLPGAVVLPCNDDAVELLARHRARLAPYYRLIPTNDQVVLDLLDKARTYELARGIEVATPRVWVIDNREGLAAVLRELPFPCALKPRHSHLFKKRFGAKLFVAEDEAQLARRFEETHSAGLQMLVTEIIPGREDQYVSYWTYVDGSGAPLFHFTKRKLRQYPPYFGLGTFHVTDWNPEVAELGLRFALGVGLRGLAVVEFKRDARDGRLKLIECNVRITKATEIAIRSGIDVPMLVYNHVTGRPLPKVHPYRSGTRLWFPFDDYRAFAAYRRSGELSTWAWLSSLGLRPGVAQLQWSDPLPVAMDLFERFSTWLSTRIRLLRSLSSLFGARQGRDPAARGPL